VSLENNLRAATQSGWGLSLYRFAINIALLSAGFHAFPSHKTLFALIVISAGLCVAAVLAHQQILNAVNNTILDAAERKTRFTIVVAQERASRGENCDNYTFWGEVDDRVATELGAPDPKPTILTTSLMVAQNVFFLVVGDLITVGLALLISGYLQSI